MTVPSGAALQVQLVGLFVAAADKTTVPLAFETVLIAVIEGTGRLRVTV